MSGGVFKGGLTFATLYLEIPQNACNISENIRFRNFEALADESVDSRG